MKYPHYLYLILVLIVSVASSHAQARLPELKKGMSNLEVLKLWGSPLEKIEKEIKRKDVWVYKNSRLVFLNGTLLEIEDAQGKKVENEVSNTEQAAKLVRQAESTPVANQDVVDDILSEIMQDPSNQEPGDHKPAAQAAQSNVISQVPPPEVIQ
jgi:hypothetical protein